MNTSYPHQKALLLGAVILSSLFWLGLVLLALTAADKFLPDIGREIQAATFLGLVILTYTARYIRNAGRVAYLRGHAVEINAKQQPDLHVRLRAVCKRLDIEQPPTAYLYQELRLGNSFSLRFHKRNYIALNGELIGALTDRQGAIDFYMGYELARINDRYARWDIFLFPATVLPLLGPAFVRANIYTYDRYGLAVTKSKVDAVYALAVQASGSRRWKSFNIAQFAAQSASANRYWSSLFELVSAIPPLSQRVAQLRAIATSSDTFIARRHPLAYITALFLPYLGLRARGSVARLACIPLWAAVIVFLTILGHRQLVNSGVLAILESQYENKVVPLFTQTQVPLPSKSARRSAKTQNATDPYARLDNDLKLLGKFALERQRKYGGIPCEIGNIGNLRLNYPAKRYAFSCNEPQVYTIVGLGEFEPGRPSYPRTYDWKNNKFVQGAAETPPL
jgi:hypothetical protein